MNKTKLFTFELIIICLVSISIVFYLQKSVVNNGVRNIDTDFAGTHEELALNIPEGFKLTQKAIISNNGNRVLLFGTNKEELPEILLWENSIGIRSIDKQNSKEETIKSPILSADGKTIFFLKGNADKNKIYRWQDGFPIDLINYELYSSNPEISCNENGSKIFVSNLEIEDKKSVFITIKDQEKNIGFPNSGLKSSNLEFEVQTIDLKSKIIAKNFKANLITVIEGKEKVQDLSIKQIIKKSKVNMLDVNSDAAEDLLAFAPASPFPYWRSYTLDGQDGLKHQEAERKGILSNYRVGSPKGIPIPGDYNGDGVLDLATFSPGNGANNSESKGQWQIYISQAQKLTEANFIQPNYQYLTYQLGRPSALPVPADYDGDGTTDIALYNYGSQNWQIVLSRMGFDLAKALNNISRYGINFSMGELGDLPIKADYNGDGLADFILISETNDENGTSTWKIKLNQPDIGGSKVKIKNFGKKNDIPFVADIDCDGKDDLGVFRPSDISWNFLFKDESEKKVNWQLGFEDGKGEGAMPFTGDFDGDGCADLGFYEPNAKYNKWHIVVSGVKDSARNLFAASWNMVINLNFTDKDLLPIQAAQWQANKMIAKQDKE